MTETNELEPQQAEASRVTDGWDDALPELQRRWPNQKPGILFCVFKLQQDAGASLRDFRDEAKLRGLSLGGRSLHSAKVLLGLEQPAVRRPNTDAKARTKPAAKPRRDTSLEGSLEEQLIDNVKRIQEAAAADAERLRTAIRTAIRVLEDALDD